jgi:outer membrane protein assembly factor BamB
VGIIREVPIMCRSISCLIVVMCAGLAVSAPVPKETQPSAPYVKWTVKPESEQKAMNSPLVVKSLIVVGSEHGELQAYRKDDGKSVWTYGHGKRIYHHLSADDDRVYFSAADGFVAVNVSDGAKVWSVEADQGDGPVLATKEKGVVFAADNNGTLYSLDAKSGKKLWTADFLADAPADPPGFDGNRARLAPAKARPNSLAFDGETVFLTVFDQCRVAAFEASTGKRKWSFQTQGWVGGDITVTATGVFLGSQDTFFYCLDKKTGKEVWKFPAKNRTDTGCVVDDQHVYFGTSAGNLFSLSQKDGKEIWRFKADARTDGRNYSTGSRTLLQKGTLWFSSHDGKFYGVMAASGKRLCMLQPAADSDLSSWLIGDGQSFYVTTNSHYVEQGQQTGGNALIAISLK